MNCTRVKLGRSMAQSFPSHQVYARCLAGDRGYPLWTPQPNQQLPDDYRRGGLKIGDVGIISPIDGSFDVLFNITLPPNEQRYPELVRGSSAATPEAIPHRELSFATLDDAVTSTYDIIPSTFMKPVSKTTDPTGCNQWPPMYVAFLGA